jgi:hypothetical protein
VAEEDLERLLSMSAFEAAYLLRKFRLKHPNFSDEDIILTARSIKADNFPHDYVSGLMLEKAIADFDLEEYLEDFFLAAIDVSIMKNRPLWIRIAPSGRDHVLRVMGVNEIQCLRAAGLMNTTQRAIDWWDRLALLTRNERDAQLLAQGRQAERLSLLYERDRLHRLGISQEPQWIALEDNTVGYDILSYSWSSEAIVNQLIEVKSSYQSPPRLILTRNEWESAIKFGERFQFHLWSLPSETLRILSVADVEPHVPKDRSEGRWLQTEISLLAFQDTVKHVS